MTDVSQARPARGRSAMALRQRLILTILLVGVIVSIPSMYAFYQLRQLRAIATAATRTHGVAYSNLGRYQARLGEVNRHESSYIILQDPVYRASRDSAIISAGVHLRSVEQAGYREEVAPAIAQLQALVNSMTQIDQLLTAGQAEQATAAFDRVKDGFSEAQVTIDTIFAAIDAQSRDDTRRASVMSAAAVTTTGIALMLSCAVALAVAAWMTRGLLRPVAQLRHAMARVAAGSFVVPEDLPYERTDEIGDLSRSFRSMTQRLSDFDQLKAEFMSISTHELKTPINVIGGYAELIQEKIYGDLTAKQDEALTAIREQSHILTQMVNQLLDVSRIEAGGLHLDIQDFVVQDLFERVHRTFLALARKQDITFTVDLEKGTPRRVPGDADRLRDQVLGNLISNAFKFTPSGGRVEVRGWEQDGWLCICVTDTGPGIPEEQQTHIFDKFYQVAGQSRSKGAGLGLTIAHEVVQGHGGDISVDSKPGEGTTFEIKLPLTREQAARAHAERERRMNEQAAVVAAADPA